MAGGWGGAQSARPVVVRAPMARRGCAPRTCDERQRTFRIVSLICFTLAHLEAHSGRPAGLPPAAYLSHPAGRKTRGRLPQRAGTIFSLITWRVEYPCGRSHRHLRLVWKPRGASGEDCSLFTEYTGSDQSRRPVCRPGNGLISRPISRQLVRGARQHTMAAILSPLWRRALAGASTWRSAIKEAALDGRQVCHVYNCPSCTPLASARDTDGTWPRSSGRQR